MKISAKAGEQLFELVVERENGGYVVEIDGKRHLVDAQKLEGDFYTILTEGRSYEVSVEPHGDGYQVRHGAAQQIVTLSDPSRRAREKQKVAEGPLTIVSVMPGRVVRILVSEGDEVAEGQGLVVIEAMKMENEITAPKAGVVRNIAVEAGQSIEGGGVLLVVD